jgi:hypothetical protein
MFAPPSGCRNESCCWFSVTLERANAGFGHCAGTNELASTMRLFPSGGASACATACSSPPCQDSHLSRYPFDFSGPTGRVKLIVVHFGGVTASTEVIAVKRHTGVHASEIVCKNTIANQNLAYAA